MKLPSDINILVSMLNMRLRDEGLDLCGLCAREDLDREELMDRLRHGGFCYDEKHHCFYSVDET